MSWNGNRDRLAGEILHFGISALKGKAVALSWIDRDDSHDLHNSYRREFRDLYLGEAYFRAYLEDKKCHRDPFSEDRLKQSKEPVSCLSLCNRTIERDSAEYVRFLNEFGFGDEIDFLFCYYEEPIAILTLMTSIRTHFSGDIDNYLAIHRYIHFTFSFDPKIQRMRQVETLKQTFNLTARETEVALLVADAASNADVAEILNIGLPTVKTHVVNIFDKMGIESRNQIGAVTRNI